MFKGLLFLGVLLATAGCHNYSANVGEALGCALAGNGCDDGRTGEQGLTGQPGANGASCSVQTVEAGGVAPNGGARISCTDGSDALLLNGTDGANAPSVLGIQQVVRPCPNLIGSFPEVFLVLTDRTILAYFTSNGSALTARLAALTPGSYQTSDGRNCTVNITLNSISWAGGSATY